MIGVGLGSDNGVSVAPSLLVREGERSSASLQSCKGRKGKQNGKVFAGLLLGHRANF